MLKFIIEISLVVIINMYSDKYWNTKTKYVHDGCSIDLPDRSISCCYVKDENDKDLYFQLDFEYADDGHIEILPENLPKLQEALQKITNINELIPSLKYFFEHYSKRRFEYDDLIKLLSENGIVHEAIIFY